ncbi:hypothetical protein A2625_00670 [candidate division WOR-1 bacterium RIFCSPHIGHO2_01_FULL_53_15]|uniref:HTH lysR-type domain-containing protein n=1 Tax=candidate division WOR-1 bacterium RIFCSPHIGHO2_01_FULL_53_15 TaxID=1802564 RepID=A0A1F4Q3B7_UNCSA|nr:MAG: hypothetical protein A2625_00670 [candidate division WOR-1 bacterium RIFCSPHIGHO2_01_FULL_53_15]OGC12678.1 MAG: hypothetical protein A3D23_02935 [candidate division WOR-1 bacterium RIFCSPHIGHO2_02_FULL_53_26]
MQLEDLKIWVDLAETKSFSECAWLNFLTQPAISQKFKRLEAEFGSPLLARSGKIIDLSPAGKILYEESRKILNAYQLLCSRLKSLSGTVQGTLKVATIYSIGLYELNPCIKHFLKKFPGVDLDISFSHSPKIYQDLLERRIEIGFVAYPKEQPRLKIIPFKNDSLILVTPPRHPLARYKRIEINKISGFEFIGFKKDIPTREALDKIFKKHRVEAKVKMEFDNIETVKQAVEIGAGISILPSATVKKEIAHGLLKGIRFSNARLPRPLAAVIRSGETLSPPAENFLKEMIRAL